MAQFTRRTILAATDILTARTHAGLDRFSLEHGLERIAVGNSKQEKTNALGRYLISHPDLQNEYGENVSDAIVTAIVGETIEASRRGWPPEFSFEDFQADFALLYRGLERDGFTVEGGALRRTLPNVIDLPAADDEVHILLEQFAFTTPRGHLDQGITNHASGQWAAANAQFRTFIESLLDEIAGRAPAPQNGHPPPGHQRRQWLANMPNPFFSAGLNEWGNDGRGFFEGLFRRLHPEGSHPGLSDEEDSTFRLHLVLLASRHLLRRLAALTRAGGR